MRFTKQNDTVIFSCDPGLVLAGNTSMECLKDGSWTGHIPNCVKPGKYKTLDTCVCRKHKLLGIIYWFSTSKLPIIYSFRYIRSVTGEQCDPISMSASFGYYLVCPMYLFIHTRDPIGINDKLKV